MHGLRQWEKIAMMKIPYHTTLTNDEITSFSGFEITKKNHRDGDIFEHSFKLKAWNYTQIYLYHSDFSSLFRTLGIMLEKHSVH